MNRNEQTCSTYPRNGSTRFGIINKLARSLVLKSLATIEEGGLTLIDGGEHHEFGRQGSELTATVRVQHPDFYRRVAFGGTIAAGESYMDGLWSCSDLTALIRIMVRNQEAQQELEGGLAKLTVPLQRLLHRLNDNTRRGSRRNIAAHYDLGNDFYRLFLDPTMVYSCGIFERADSTLEEASTAKFDRICRKLGLAPGMRVLEIGTGWGGFAIHAARNYGCHITTTTISRQQHDLAAEKIADCGLKQQITLLQRDYRDLTGQFDRLVSIEMIEAVGHRHLPVYFRTCSERLKSDGAALIQAITMPDHQYSRYLKAPDFINRYIFPGSCCPSLQAITAAVARETDLRLTHLEDITPHYARTLREWRNAFYAHLEQVRGMGFDDRFVRMWEFYLCYCEGGFAERFTGNLQLLFTKPLYRGEPLLPPLAGNAYP
ncbi:SAM-dependent methyltransferase [Desulfuromonas acetexigens]|jgi:cyclopropane-fatty-acyl-phospholipid synthase|uniref:Class I SAM-dependent methyltransferase n=1 Tax=Trichloromonas acetexigens TaxID=38815 RepID=A0A550JGF6_9BACT|nr:cyclopropane-fatty-acyl-phospholipid synthase family protein [Desulfuromonas acetexigens]TRO82299.1 class I SAM-dependent methyltransferase [Desulfuromonas acetexigens]